VTAGIRKKGGSGSPQRQVCGFVSNIIVAIHLQATLRILMTILFFLWREEFSGKVKNEILR
jgi:hypothetical protein